VLITAGENKVPELSGTLEIDWNKPVKLRFTPHISILVRCHNYSQQVQPNAAPHQPQRVPVVIIDSLTNMGTEVRAFGVFAQFF
jgi:hypothetical protein